MKRLLYLLAVSMLVSCSDKSGNTTPAATDSIPVMASRELDAHELPLPEIPDSITVPSAKADYMMLHFWDAMDFSDPAQIADTLLLEQTFANFAYLLPSTSGTEAIDDAFGALVRQSAVSPSATGRIAEIAEKYLYDVESPLQSDTMFRIYLEKLTEQNPAAGARYRELLKEVRQNETGSVAPDFKIASTSLSDISKEALYTLLVFYENDCIDCRNTIEMMKADPNIAGLVATGAIKVVAVDLSPSQEVPVSLPEEWIGIRSEIPEELYVMRRNPSLYLIDNERRVVLKDTTYPVVASCLK